MAEPAGYTVILEAKGAKLIKLLPPQGFCALSDIVHFGDTEFNKSSFACINISFCQPIKAKIWTTMSEHLCAAESVWPHGTASA